MSKKLVKLASEREKRWKLSWIIKRDKKKANVNNTQDLKTGYTMDDGPRRDEIPWGHQ